MPTVRAVISETAKGVATAVGMTAGAVIFWACIAALPFVVTLLFHLI